MFVPNLPPSTSSIHLSPSLLFLHYSNPVNFPSFSPLTFHTAKTLLQKPTSAWRFFSFLITMSLWMWPPPAVHISSVYSVGVNFHFSLLIFRQGRDEVWFIQEIAPAAILMRDLFGYKQGIIIVSEWQWRKSTETVLLTGRQWINPSFFFISTL